MDRMESEGLRGGIGAPGRRGTSLAACVGGVVGLAIALLVVEWLVPRPLEVLRAGGWAARGAAVLAAAVALTALWLARRALFRALTSLPFAVSLLAVILAATMLGTFILQGEAPAEYSKRYGKAVAGAFLALRLDDLFHALWFRGLLSLLAVSLALVVFRNRAWRPAFWGHLLAHAGVIAVLAAGLAWSIGGFRGTIDLHEGQSATEAVRLRRGVPTAGRLPLGFALRLEDFDIERYPPEHRFYVYAAAGKSFDVVRSYGLKEAGEWRPIGKSGAEFRVRRHFPDFHMRAELREAAPGRGGPALEIDWPGGGAGAHPGGQMRLLAGKAGRDTADLVPLGGPRVRLLPEAPPEPEVARWAEPRAETHVLVVHGAPGAPPEEIEVRPGAEVEAGGGAWRLRVLEAIPDFIYDTQARKPASRSPHPNNPALQVVVVPKDGGPETTRWLFAKMPDFGMDHGKTPAGPRLVYRHVAAYQPAPKEVVVVAKTSEAWELEGGRVVRRSPLPPDGSLPGVPAAKVRLLGNAEEVRVPETRSPEWRNPVAEVEVRGPGAEGPRSQMLSAVHGEPLRLPDGKTLLAFAPKPDDVKAYRSRLAVIRGGRKVAEQVVEVNAPLSYGGFSFYQSNYRKEDPTYSGILVVRDPGLPLAWLGFVMVSLGMIFVYYVRPRMKGGAEPSEGSP